MPLRTKAELRLWKKMQVLAGPSIQTMFDWKRGARLGEASNPGPAVELLATNPTSLTDKIRHFAEMDYHVAMLSEVAATEAVQPEICERFLKKGIKVLFGYPSPPRGTDLKGRPMRRGLQLGTAIACRCPCRDSGDPMPGLWLQTGRISEAIVKLGHLTVKVVAVYGFHAATPEYKTKNDQLLAMVLARVQNFQFLTIVGGDFNQPPETAPIWEQFRALGYVNTTTVARQRWPQKVTPTCSGATNNDTILLPQPLADRMADFNILLHHTMGAHTPMQVTLELPGEQLLEKRIRLPKTMNQFELSREDVQAHCPLQDEPDDIQAKYDEWSRYDPDDAFKWWSQQFESAVDQALRHRADPQKGDFLPTAHKGYTNLLPHAPEQLSALLP